VPASVVPVPDVIVIGAGVIGVSTAWSCARRGLTVTLFERDGLAAHASGRNQGLLIPPAPPAMVGIAERSVELYLELHERSRGVFAFDVEPHGCLVTGVGLSDVAPAGLHGAGFEEVAGTALRRLEPLLAADVERAVVVRDARRIDPGAAVAALAGEAAALGVDVQTHTEVRELVVSGGRVRGVLAEDGVHDADVVVVAAGPWSWRVCRNVAADVAVRGVRGWLVVTRPAPFRLLHAVEEGGWSGAKARLAAPTVADLAAGRSGPLEIAGLVQQDHAGRLLLGASLQHSPRDDPDGDAAVSAVCSRAAALVPAVAKVPVAEVRSCRRPLSDDGLPLHGPLPGLEGLVLACGHGSTGIAWGPGSGELVAEGIVGGSWDPALLPSRPTLRLGATHSAAS